MITLNACRINSIITEVIIINDQSTRLMADSLEDDSDGDNDRRVDLRNFQKEKVSGVILRCCFRNCEEKSLKNMEYLKEVQWRICFDSQGREMKKSSWIGENGLESFLSQVFGRKYQKGAFSVMRLEMVHANNVLGGAKYLV